MKNKKRLIVIFIIFAIVLGIMVGMHVFNKKNNSQLTAKVENSVLSDKQKDILGIYEDEESKKENEIDEKSKSDLYKEYEKKSDDEKKESDVVPRKKKVPYKEIDNIKKDEENSDNDNSNGLPKKFNLADKISINVEDQGFYGLCWDFASMTSLETFLSLKENKDYDFSEMHLNYIESELMYGDRQIDEGGNFYYFKDYLAVSGVVPEEKVPYKDYNKDEYKKFASMDRAVTVTKTVDFPDFTKYEEGQYSEKEINKFRETVKTHIMNNGSLYAQVIGPNDVNSYYDTTEEGFINHAVSIVGWDDNYSKDKFTSPNGKKPKKNGAYIVLNSWGESFGEDGFYYVSYEDKYIESALSGVLSVSLSDAKRIDNMENTVLKHYIEKKYGPYIIEKNGKSYLPNFVINENGYFDLSDLSLTSVKDIDVLGTPYGLDLSNNNIKDVSELKRFKELEYVNLENNKGVTGYENIKTLEEINLTSCDVSDVSNLSELKNLNAVVLNDNKDIKNLDKLPSNIYSLAISNCGINSIKNINGFKELGSLEIKKNNLTSLDGIEKLTSLAELDISLNDITDFKGLEKLSNLYSLVAEDCSIEDITIFNGLNISELMLRENSISDLSNFDASGVNSIDLSGNRGLTGFEKLKDVYCVILKNCDISDLSEVIKMENVEVLDLSINEITNISDLGKLSNLHMLSLAGNKGIEGAIPENIDTINLSDCGLDDEYDFSSLKTCSNINIGNNDIKDISKIIDMHDEYVSIFAEGIYIDEKEFNEINEISKPDSEDSYWSCFVTGAIIEYSVDKVDSNQNIDLDNFELLQGLCRRALNDKTLSIKNATVDRTLDWIRVKNLNSKVKIDIDGFYGNFSELYIRIKLYNVQKESEDEEENIIKPEENIIEPENDENIVDNTTNEENIIEENATSEENIVTENLENTESTENNL